MTEAEVKTEARFVAIEYMVANAYVVLHRILKTPPQTVALTHQKAREMLSKTTIPGVDAARSDLAAAEIQEAVERLIGAIEEMLASGGTQSK